MGFHGQSKAAKATHMCTRNISHKLTKGWTPDGHPSLVEVKMEQYFDCDEVDALPTLTKARHLRIRKQPSLALQLSWFSHGLHLI